MLIVCFWSYEHHKKQTQYFLNIFFMIKMAYSLCMQKLVSLDKIKIYNRIWQYRFHNISYYSIPGSCYCPSLGSYCCPSLDFDYFDCSMGHSCHPTQNYPKVLAVACYEDDDGDDDDCSDEDRTLDCLKFNTHLLASSFCWHMFPILYLTR